MNYRYVGKPLPIRDGALKVTGQAKYTADLYFPHMLYGKILFSPVAHARIKKIDTSIAENVPGVKAIVTYLNSPQIKFNSACRFLGHAIPETERIFDSTVRYVGDKVAAVAAESPEIARQAIKLIRVEYEELPAAFTPEESLRVDAYPIHPGGNIVSEIQSQIGDITEAFEQADLFISSRITTPKVHHCAIEPHVSIAHWSQDAKLTVWSPHQNIFATRLLLAKIFHLPIHRIHMIKPTIGGAFGGKLEMVLEPVVALLAQITGQYVKIELTRKETMVSTRTRHATSFFIKTALTKDGIIIGQEIDGIIDTGAYASSALNVTGTMCGKAFELYKVPNMSFKAVACYTNTPISGAMRGYGSPQLITTLEIHMDEIARKLKLDPVELRLKNLVRPYQQIHSNHALGNCRIVDCLEKGAHIFQWEKRKKTNEKFVRTGFGVSCGVHGNGVFPIHRDYTCMTLKLNEDGSAILLTGIHDLGSGSYTILTQIISEILDIEPELIEVIEADTENTPYDLGAYASRNTWVGGAAAKKLAEKMLTLLFGMACEILNTREEDITFDHGKFTSKSAPQKSISPAHIVSYCQEKKQQELIATISYHSTFGPPTYGAHFAHVKIDLRTGKVNVIDYAAVHDVGKAINPLLLEGQIQGGIQMGLGFALSEELKIDPTSGQLMNAHLAKYHIPKAKDMPPIHISFVEETEEPGPFGAKSIGEVATVPVAAAIINAINDALGTSFSRLPVTQEMIKKHIEGGQII
ncbi:xanthine dehydrogenase family protein molybdopterin-binding subunit [Candidatus Formimonas warabiya]|uniref:Aldehyde oxidase/xanthine dehydrogenase a/b hammerhead domain-containing protein n=1 Tax=Formimonas warabiya TaxID=1761012 RepID=A0A3G1KTT6_FORW1|nr:molybdopterin cofactor-binding domain-containing protein [Candidatus Formimonas warabiya]ATW25871.1 hypothetical protein DCMF_14810 [Candidatus Formimonas warabiya]